MRRNETSHGWIVGECFLANARSELSIYSYKPEMVELGMLIPQDDPDFIFIEFSLDPRISADSLGIDLGVPRYY